MKYIYHVIGVMSGTSLDGIDLVYASFTYNESWSYDIVYSETLPYSNIWQQKLTNLVRLTSKELLDVDKAYTVYLAEVITAFIRLKKLSVIDAVCSHGHTALHKPEAGVTYQIGNRQELAKLIGQKVVCDFRVQDVKLGGQGAPLVPIGDRLLFSNYAYCLNLGGFANVSMEKNNERIAFDICPVNIVLNKYVRNLGFDYDDRGIIASSGKINEDLLNKLSQLQFYAEKPPKSLGLEWVNQEISPIIDAFNLNVKDILCTFCEHIAIQISKVITKNRNSSVLITGGGAYNNFLIERLQVHSNNKLIIPERNLVDFKEGLLFGFLGVLRLRKEVNCLKSVTGASHDHSSGVIFQP